MSRVRVLGSGRVWVGFVVIWGLISLAVAQAGADIPRSINYQGRLTDVAGQPLVGSHDMIFSIYDAPLGGSELWSETKSAVSDSAGVFATVLGSDSPIDIPFSDPCWLEITVDGETLTPRREITSVAFAFRSLRADSLGGFSADGFVRQGEASSITTLMLADGAIVDADIAEDAAIDPAKIAGGGWTSGNDGAGSGLASTGYRCGVFARAAALGDHDQTAVYAKLDQDSQEAYLCFRQGTTKYKVLGTGIASSIMATSEGRVTMACPESPEAWIEDYGSGEIKSGSCHVDLDPTYLQCITVDEANPLKVFVQITSALDQQYYVKKSSDGFDVVVLGAGASEASGTFDYKVVGKWKGYESFRFERAPESPQVTQVSSTGDGQ